MPLVALRVLTTAHSCNNDLPTDCRSPGNDSDECLDTQPSTDVVLSILIAKYIASGNEKGLAHCDATKLMAAVQSTGWAAAGD